MKKLLFISWAFWFWHIRLYRQQSQDLWIAESRLYDMRADTK